MILTYFFLFILGLAVGSFLNVLIDRLPAGKTILGRSHCDSCRRTLSGLDLFPVLSYLYLRGRCRYCKKKLSLYYPFVELLTGLSFVIVWHLTFTLIPFPLISIIYLVAVNSLIVIFFADVKYHIIPDSMQIVLFIMALILLIIHGVNVSMFFEQIIAAFVVMMPILVLYLITQGRGMGFGDVKLSFIIGFYFGLPAGLAVIYFAFVLGAVVALPLIVLGKKRLKSRIAFGPFLVLSTLFVFISRVQLLILLKALYGF